MKKAIVKLKVKEWQNVERQGVLYSADWTDGLDSRTGLMD